MQQRNAEWKCSAAGQAHVHAGEDVRERGAADTLVRGAVSGDARRARALALARRRCAGIDLRHCGLLILIL